MRRKELVTLLCLAIATCVMACGNKDNSTAQTATDTAVEATEIVETEVVATESVETTEEIVEATETEVVAETETPQSMELTYEDFEFSYNGYTNYIDFDIENPDNVGVQIVYETPKDAPEKTAENDSTARGLKLGDSRERVLELYGDYDKRVVYRNMRLKYGDLVPEENYIYYLHGYEPTTFDGLYCLIITLDTNGNVLAVQYNGALSKYM